MDCRFLLRSFVDPHGPLLPGTPLSCFEYTPYANGSNRVVLYRVVGAIGGPVGESLCGLAKFLQAARARR